MAKKKPATSPATTAPSAPPPASEEQMALPPESRLLTWRQIVPSPLNPRKEFDAEELKGLADSIRAEGVLENLLVRRTGDPAIFELAAGERRWRAVGLLVEEGVWSADEERIPAVVKSLTDAQLLVLAIIENVQRRDINPVEEGRAFAQLRSLDPVAWSTERIAEAIGKTQRHVQKRIALVERLAAPVAEALSKGEINLEQAKAFALGDEKAQMQQLKSGKRNDWARDPRQIRHAMIEKMVPVDRALFDPKLYKGTIVEDEDEGERYFADPVEFRELQDAAIEARIAALKEKWPWVERLGPNAYAWDYAAAKKGDKKAGAILWVDHAGVVHVKENVLKPRTGGEVIGGAAGAKPKKKKRTKPEDLRWLTQTQIQAVKQAKTLAMRRAVCDSPKAALAVAILAMVGSHEIDVVIPGSFQSRERMLELETPDADLAERKRRLAVVLGCLPSKHERDEIVAGYDAGLDDDTLAKAFEALMALEVDELLRILATATAPHVGTWITRNAGETPFALGLAKATGAYERLDGLWTPPPAYFAAYRRDTLVALANANGLGEGFNRLKKSEQVKLLSGQSFWTWRHFAELRFLEEKELQKAMAGPALLVPRDPPKPNDVAEELRCRACGAAALKKHKKGCALGAEGKVSAASCEPEAAAPAAPSPEHSLVDAAAGAGEISESDLADVADVAAGDALEIPPALRRRKARQAEASA